MVLRCNQCGGVVELTDDNGVVSPSDGDRVEYYECVACGAESSMTLPADGGRGRMSSNLQNVSDTY